MPQKPVYSRAPLLTVPYCFPAAGTVRTGDRRISDFYRNANRYIEQPCLWEGLFRLACLVKGKPAEEPVTNRIVNACRETETGAFSGTICEQVSAARAAFALFEYNTDRRILKRIAQWLRYLEIEFDTLMLQDGILYRPADLMELLVRFYQASGAKSALRLCSRLRAEAFDWTTALHTFQQSIPIRPENENDTYCLPSGKPAETDYLEKEKLINHGEMLADGVRYTLFAGLFSGHGQDLSSGKTIWKYLLKHHRALCGGTTGNPYLSGNAPDQPVSGSTLSAWTEAFAAQMITDDSSWAAEELIRIVYNGLDDCLNRKNLSGTQRVNTVRSDSEESADAAHVCARVSRAVASAVHHAVSVTEKGFRINYLLPARIMMMIQNQPMILSTEYDSAVIQCKETFSAGIQVFLPRTCTSFVRVCKEGEEPQDYHSYSTGCFLTDSEWHNRDSISYIRDDRVFCEDTHHHGQAFFACNRLLCYPARESEYAVAVSGEPRCINGIVTVKTVKLNGWKMNGDAPADIPVLPAASDCAEQTELKAYSSCPGRISMFPRAR